MATRCVSWVVVILGLVAVIEPIHAALNATQRNALISLGLCAATSNFTCTSSNYDSCDPGLGCITNGDLIWFGAFSGTVPWRPLTVPTQLNLFPTLTWIDISNRSLSGTIPNFIDFPQLQSLNLNTNNLTGTVQNYNMPSLTQILLYANKLSGTIPNFNFPQMKYFLLHANQFTGTIPTFNFPSLLSYYLGTNQLSGTVPNLSGYPLLAQLHLDFNSLSGTLPSLANMPGLYDLTIAYNQLFGPIIVSPNATLSFCWTIPNLAFECPLPPGCESCSNCGTQPSCSLGSKCVYPGTWTCATPSPSPTPIASPTPSATPTPSPSPSLTPTGSPTSTPRPTATPVPAPVPTPVPVPPYIVSAPISITKPILTSNFFQNSTLTVGGEALSGIAIQANAVTLGGSLVIDLSGIDAYDGMQITLVNASSISGSWQDITTTSSSECMTYDVTVVYSQLTATATLTETALCDLASALSLCFVSLI